MVIKKRFIDLFAGLGGFHLALASLGHECVFACEINEELIRLYETNFGIRPHGDIRSLDINSIPDHDILCAGFPCQPFSKAGKQNGLNCPQWGDLIDYVVQILKHKQPEFLIIENVPNLVKHDGGRTWEKILKKIKSAAGYDVTDKILSPHMFGVPQRRERAFIVGRKGGLKGFAWPEVNKEQTTSIIDILDAKPKEAKYISERHLHYLNTWDQFVKSFPKDKELPAFPIWAMEFGATYPYKDATPLSYGLHKLHKYKGSFGQPLKGLRAEGKILALPTYGRESANTFPAWKIEFIRQNREFYQEHQQLIDKWLPSILDFPPSFQKFEWNCNGEERDIWKFIIQFRASGIRIKRPNYAPSLVAMTDSQVPIIPWEKRYMTIRECARLQSMGSLKYLPESRVAAFKALGNAVNAKVVSSIAAQLEEKNYSLNRMS